VQQPSGVVLEINRSDFIMGRHSECEIRLPLPDVSRRHCRFRYENGVWTVIDLQSLNGVFVNEQPIDRAELRQGDRLRVAGFMFLIDLNGVAAQAGAEGVPALSEALFQNRHRSNTMVPQRRAS
jgi:pSer/pThr/pTyr-binding forkhead associated (FHA) protein